MSTYRREHYLAKLRPFYNDSGLIKVITGIRRCGKSSLLITVLNELFEQGILKPISSTSTSIAANTAT